MAGNGMRYVLVRILDLQDMIEDVAFNVTAHDTNTEIIRLYIDLQDCDILGPNLPDRFQLMALWSELMSSSAQKSKRLTYYTKLLSQLTQIEINVRLFLNDESSPATGYFRSGHLSSGSIKTA